MAISSMRLFLGLRDYFRLSAADYSRFLKPRTNVRPCTDFQVCPLRVPCVLDECTTCRVRPISVRECRSRPMGFRDAVPYSDDDVSDVVARGFRSGNLNRLVESSVFVLFFV